jgi:hypothetical protein
MGGSHCEAAEAVALGWEPERRGGSGVGSRRGRCIGGGEGGELELGHRTEWSEAPVSSLNWQARGESREGNGGGGARFRTEEGKREREGGPSTARHGSVDHRVGMAPGVVVRGDSVCSRQTGEQGRATGRGAAWMTGGAWWQWGPMSAAGCRRKRGK